MDIDFRGITVEIRSVPSITAQTGHSKFHVQNNVMFEVYAIRAECEVLRYLSIVLVFHSLQSLP